MNNVQTFLLGIILGIGIGTVITAVMLPERKIIYNLISECEKDLPRSSTCELYAKEKK